MSLIFGSKKKKQQKEDTMMRDWVPPSIKTSKYTAKSDKIDKIVVSNEPIDHSLPQMYKYLREHYQENSTVSFGYVCYINRKNSTIHVNRT